VSDEEEGMLPSSSPVREEGGATTDNSCTSRLRADAELRLPVRARREARSRSLRQQRSGRREG
jgi:hypothetical protein